MKFKYFVNCITVVVMTKNSSPTTYACSHTQLQWYSPPLILLRGS